MCIYVEFSEWASEQAKIYMIFPNERASWKSAPSVPSATSIAGQITALNTKIYWAQKSKKNCDQTFWIPKNSKELKSNKFYGPKRFGISKYFEPQKMLGPKKFLILKYLGWKNSGSQTNLGPKKLLLLFKFRLWKTKSTPSLTSPSSLSWVSSQVGVW